MVRGPIDRAEQEQKVLAYRDLRLLAEVVYAGYVQNEDDGSPVEESEGRFGQRTQCRLSSWTQRSEKVDAGEEVENMGEYLSRRPAYKVGL